MNTKCNKCNKYFDFRAKRGSRLKAHKCKCGGDFERITFKLFHMPELKNSYVFIDKNGKYWIIDIDRDKCEYLHTGLILRPFEPNQIKIV